MIKNGSIIKCHLTKQQLSSASASVSVQILIGMIRTPDHPNRILTNCTHTDLSLQFQINKFKKFNTFVRISNCMVYALTETWISEHMFNNDLILKLMLFIRLTFNTLLDAAMSIDLRLPLTSVGRGGLVCVLGPDCQLFG